MQSCEAKVFFFPLFFSFFLGHACVHSSSSGLRGGQARVCALHAPGGCSCPLASTVMDKQATRAGGMAAVVFRLLRAKLVE